MAEQFQSTGSRAAFVVANEEVWGTVDGSSPNWRAVRLIPGETLDENIEIYRSREMRGDRMRNASVRGSQKPGGGLPFELSPEGWNNFLYHLLGGTVTTSGPVAGMSAPSAPSGTDSASGGSLAAATYKYKITAINNAGETLPSSASADIVVAAGTTNKITLTWSAVTGATGYKVYGRTGGSFLYIATVGAVLTYVDTGAITPAGAVPGADTSGSVYTHTIKGATTLPVGFTLEKQFADQPLYIPWYGCRVGRMELNSNIDAIVSGVFNIMARQMGDPTNVSLNTDAAPTRPTVKPFTSAQAQLYETASYTLLGTCRELRLSIDNNFYGDRGFVLGSTVRNNLKPGDRVTEASGKFQFANANLYEAARRGDSTALRVFFSAPPYSVQFDFPNFEWIPNNTTPKATDDGPLEIDANGEALPSVSDETDVIVTIKTPEADITI